MTEDKFTYVKSLYQLFVLGAPATTAIWPTIAGLFIIGQLKVRLKEKHNTRNKSKFGGPKHGSKKT